MCRSFRAHIARNVAIMVRGLRAVVLPVLLAIILMSWCSVVSNAAPFSLSIIHRAADSLTVSPQRGSAATLPLPADKQIFGDDEESEEEDEEEDLPTASEEAEGDEDTVPPATTPQPVSPPDTPGDDGDDSGDDSSDGGSDDGGDGGASPAFPDTDSGTGPESDSPTETPDEAEPSAEDDGDVCVDARHLSAVPADHLVHAEHFEADVLCPTSDGDFASLPCATRNHLVLLRGEPLSYDHLCALASVSCRADRVLVNSVLSHVWVDEPHHDGALHLTMLDSRHPASLQRALHRLIAVRRAFPFPSLR